MIKVSRASSRRWSRPLMFTRAHCSIMVMKVIVSYLKARWSYMIALRSAGHFYTLLPSFPLLDGFDSDDVPGVFSARSDSESCRFAGNTIIICLCQPAQGHTYMLVEDGDCRGAAFYHFCCEPARIAFFHVRRLQTRH